MIRAVEQDMALNLKKKKPLGSAWGENRHRKDEKFTPRATLTDLAK